MKSILTLSIAITLLIFGSLEIHAQKTKKPSKPVKKQTTLVVVEPSPQTICHGAKMPAGFSIIEQTVEFDCIKKNQTGKAFVISNGETTAAVPNPYEKPQVQSANKKIEQSDDDEESRAAPAESSPKRQVFERQSDLASVVAAVEEMQDFLITFQDAGYSFRDYAAKYRTIARKVGAAEESLPRGRIKILMKNNVAILNDLGFVWEQMRASGFDFIYYRGGGKEMADKYGISPIRNSRQDFILTRQMFINALGWKAGKNLAEIKEAVNSEYSQ